MNLEPEFNLRMDCLDEIMIAAELLDTKSKPPPKFPWMNPPRPTSALGTTTASSFFAATPTSPRPTSALGSTTASCFFAAAPTYKRPTSALGTTTARSFFAAAPTSPRPTSALDTTTARSFFAAAPTSPRPTSALGTTTARSFFAAAPTSPRPTSALCTTTASSYFAAAPTPPHPTFAFGSTTALGSSLASSYFASTLISPKFGDQCISPSAYEISKNSVYESDNRKGLEIADKYRYEPSIEHPDYGPFCESFEELANATSFEPANATVSKSESEYETPSTPKFPWMNSSRPTSTIGSVTGRSFFAATPNATKFGDQSNVQPANKITRTSAFESATRNGPETPVKLAYEPSTELPDYGPFCESFEELAEATSFVPAHAALIKSAHESAYEPQRKPVYESPSQCTFAYETSSSPACDLSISPVYKPSNTSTNESLSNCTKASEPSNESTHKPSMKPTNEPSWKPANDPSIKPAVERSSKPVSEYSSKPAHQTLPHHTFASDISNKPLIKPPKSYVYEPTRKCAYEPQFKPGSSVPKELPTENHKMSSKAQSSCRPVSMKQVIHLTPGLREINAKHIIGVTKTNSKLYQPCNFDRRMQTSEYLQQTTKETTEKSDKVVKAIIAEQRLVAQQTNIRQQHHTQLISKSEANQSLHNNLTNPTDKSSIQSSSESGNYLTESKTTKSNRQNSLIQNIDQYYVPTNNLDSKVSPTNGSSLNSVANTESSDIKDKFMSKEHVAEFSYYKSDTMIRIEKIARKTFGEESLNNKPTGQPFITIFHDHKASDKSDNYSENKSEQDKPLPTTPNEHHSSHRRMIIKDEPSEARRKKAKHRASTLAHSAEMYVDIETDVLHNMVKNETPCDPINDQRKTKKSKRKKKQRQFDEAAEFATHQKPVAAHKSRKSDDKNGKVRGKHHTSYEHEQYTAKCKIKSETVSLLDVTERRNKVLNTHRDSTMRPVNTQSNQEVIKPVKVNAKEKNESTEITANSGLNSSKQRVKKPAKDHHDISKEKAHVYDDDDNEDSIRPGILSCDFNFKAATTSVSNESDSETVETIADAKEDVDDVGEGVSCDDDLAPAKQGCFSGVIDLLRRIFKRK